VAHFWTHPENVVTQPRTLGNFKAIVEEVARARDRYGISVQTQLEYCQSLDHSQ
jgi:hypothetical protein